MPKLHFRFMILIQGLISNTWMQVRWGFGLNRDNWFCQRITICCGHNLPPLNFDLLGKNLMGISLDLKLNIAISLFLLIYLLDT